MPYNNVSKIGGGETFLGMSKSVLAGLPSNLRGELIGALSEADEAAGSGDPRRQAVAAERVEKAAGSLREHQGERAVERLFMESLRPLRGDHDVIRELAQRAGARV